MKTKKHPIQTAIDIGLQHREVFDWQNAQDAFKKVKEEVLELEEVLVSQYDSEKIFEELSDVFFTLLQVTRHLKIDPEVNIDFANQKYALRSKKMFELIQNDNKVPKDLQGEDLEDYWRQAKKETAKDLDDLLKFFARSTTK